MPEPTAATLKLTREREPGTPWELGDRLLITFTDEHGWELEHIGFACTAVHDGKIIEAISESLPLTRLSFAATPPRLAHHPECPCSFSESRFACNCPPGWPQ